MGGSCGKSSANIQQVANPTSSHHDNRNAEYTPYLAIENARNVNHKYAVFFQIISRNCLSLLYLYSLLQFKRIKKQEQVLERHMPINLKYRKKNSK